MVVQRLQAETIASFDEFWHCAGCDRVYWKGSHYDRLQQRVAAALRGVREGAEDPRDRTN